MSLLEPGARMDEMMRNLAPPLGEMAMAIGISSGRAARIVGTPPAPAAARIRRSEGCGDSLARRRGGREGGTEAAKTASS